jgi:cholesterol transport system auxiliary component
MITGASTLPLRRALALGALALALLAAGCANPLTRTPPEKRFYVLEAAGPAAPQAAAPPEGSACLTGRSVLKIRNLRVSPRYDEREMVYRVSDISYISDFYNAYFIPPAQLVTAETVRWLGRAGLCGHVVDAGSDLEPTHTLEGSVASLYGDFRDQRAPKAVLEIQFLLLKEGKLLSDVAYQKSFRKEVPLPEATPQALVRGLDTALTEILRELTADLGRAGQ